MNVRPHAIASLSGALLVVVGIVLIVAQFYLQVTTPEFSAPSRSVGIEAGGAKAEVATTYVGLALVVVGALLESVALVVKRS